MKNLVLTLMPLLLLAVIGDTRDTDYGTVDEDEDDIYYDEDPITAEPGTSYVIDCTFTHHPSIKPTSIILMKCEPGRLCEEDDIIFNSGDVNATTDQFRGRVSLLEPDLSKKNCSVRINDPSIWMSGSYQVGVNGQRNGLYWEIRTILKKPINVTGLRQPRIIGQTTVEEGQTLNLTCEAESSPPSNVTWTEAGSDTALVSGIQKATLVIPTVTTGQSGSVYICTAKHLEKMKTAFARLVVTDTDHDTEEIIYDEDPITAEPGTSYVIDCTFTHRPAFKPTSIILRKCESGRQCEEDDTIFDSGDVNATTGQFRGRVSLLEPDLSKKNCSIRIDDPSIWMSGSYQVGVNGQMNGRPKELRTDLKKPINVTGLRQPRIIGQTTVEEGGILNLTCEAESSPPSNVTWTEAGSDTPLVSGIQTATLVIPTVTTGQSGSVYICTAKHLEKMKTAFARLVVTFFQKSDGFLRVWLPIVLLAGAVALAAIIAYYFYRRRKTIGEPRGQADAPQAVIPQDQQTGEGGAGGSADHGQTFQDVGVAAAALPSPQLQTTRRPRSAQGELPAPSATTTSSLDDFPSLVPSPPATRPLLALALLHQSPEEVELLRLSPSLPTGSDPPGEDL